MKGSWGLDYSKSEVELHSWRNYGDHFIKILSAYLEIFGFLREFVAICYC